MPRVVLIDPAPNSPRHVPPDALVITPHQAAAAAAETAHVSLRRLAREVLRNAGFGVVSQIRSHALLKQAVLEIAPVADASAVAGLFKQTLQTVLRTGIDTNEMIRCGSKRVKQFARVAELYRKKLRAEGLVDDQEVVWQASLLPVEKKKLVIYGYHRGRKEEIHFIDAVAGEGSIYYLPCHEDPIFTANRLGAFELERLGWSLESTDEIRPASTGSAAAERFLEKNSKALTGVHAFRSPDVEAEVRGVLSAAKEMVCTGADPAGIAFVCRDISIYAPVVSVVAREYGLPVTTGWEIPLAETRVGWFVRLLLDAACGDLPFEATAQLLNHAYGPGMPENAWDTARKNHTTTFDGWTALGVDIDCLRWEGDERLSERINCLKNVLARFEVRRKSGVVAREAAAFNCFRESLEELAATEPDRPLTRQAFASLVNEVLVSVKTPFDTAAGGIVLAEPNIIVGAEFDHVFAMGLSEGIFPAVVVDNPVVDFHERDRLIKEGIEFEEAAEVPRWEALSFYFLLLSARTSLHLSFPECVNDEEKIKGIFFDRLEVEPEPLNNSRAASPEEMRRFHLGDPAGNWQDPVFLAAKIRHEVEAERESVNACGEFDGSIGVRIDPAEREWSVSQLTALGQCGFKWFAQKLLRLRSLEEMDGGLTPLTRGNLYHKALELAAGKAIGAADIRQAVLENLEEAFAEAEQDKEKVKLPVLPNWDLQRLEHLEALRKAVTSPAFIKEGSEVVAVEADYDAEWQGFRLRGSIDRVDRGPDGLYAVDYKTSSSAPTGVQNAAGKANIDVQLPIYVNVALPKLYPGEDAAGGEYYSLTKGTKIKGVKAEIKQELTDFAARAAGMLQTGNFAVGPDADGKVCTYCDLDIVCRTGYRLSRKGGAE